MININNSKSSLENKSSNDISRFENNINKDSYNDNSISLNQDFSCEDLHKVNINDNKQLNSKKKHPLLIAFFIIVTLLIILLFIFLKLIDNTSILQEHFDDIDKYKLELINEFSSDEEVDLNDTKALQQKAIEYIFNNMKINNDGTATINISKGFIYSFVDLNTLNDLSYLKDNNIVINQIGFDLDTSNNDNNYINLYGNITYKGIKAGLTGQLYFIFDDNDDLIIKFSNAQIGNLPNFLYKNSLPKKGQILYQKNLNYYIELANTKIQVFSPSDINDINYDFNTGVISIVFDYNDALNNIGEELFDDSNGSSKFSEILNYYLNIGSNNIDDIIDNANDYLKDNFGIDINNLDNINDIFSLFN